MRRILGDLLALEREIVELGYVRRADSLERARDAVRRLRRSRLAAGNPRSRRGRARRKLAVRPGPDQRGRRPRAPAQRDLVARRRDESAASALGRLRSTLHRARVPADRGRGRHAPASRDRQRPALARTRRAGPAIGARLELLRSRPARRTRQGGRAAARGCDRERARARRGRRRGCGELRRGPVGRVRASGAARDAQPAPA